MIQFITAANQSSALDATCKDSERSKDQAFSTKNVSITLHTRYKSLTREELMEKLVINYVTIQMSVRKGNLDGF
jgi:hypothetical protein